MLIVGWKPAIILEQASLPWPHQPALKSQESQITAKKKITKKRHKREKSRQVAIHVGLRLESWDFSGRRSEKGGILCTVAGDGELGK